MLTNAIRPLFIAIVLCNTLLGISQTNTVKQEKWKIGLNFSPDIYLDPASTSLSEDAYIGYDVEPSGFNFTSGLMGILNLKPRFDIGTGILFSKKDFTGTFHCEVCDLIGIPKPELFKQRFAEIPVFVRYSLLDNKFDIHIETGLSGGYLINKIQNQYGPEILTNRFALNGKLGLGFNLDLGQKFNLNLSAIYNQSLTDFYKESSFRFRTLGLSAGIIYKIRKEIKGS